MCCAGTYPVGVISHFLLSFITLYRSGGRERNATWNLKLYNKAGERQSDASYKQTKQREVNEAKPHGKYFEIKRSVMGNEQQVLVVEKISANIGGGVGKRNEALA